MRGGAFAPTDRSGCKTSAARHRAIIETTAEGYWKVDGKGRVQAVNNALCRLLGVEKSAVLGRQATDFVTTSGRAILKARLSGPSGREVPRLEVDLVGETGRLRHTRFAITLLRNDLGHPNGWFAVITDLTDHKRTEEKLSLRELRHCAIIDTVAEGYWELDPQRRTVRVDEALVRMLGYPEAEMLNPRPVDFVDHAN